MASRTIAANTNLSQSVGHTTDVFSKAHSGSPFAVQSVSGNAIQIHSDGGVWDTVANKFLQDKDVKRNG